MFQLSNRSKERLEGVNAPLAEVVEKAITLTKVDFGVIEGLRSKEKQEELVASGASQTMKSKHLTGDAVDLMAYVNGRACWELNVYDEIADAMKEAAKELGVSIRWGAAWNINNLAEWKDSAEDAMNHYIDERRGQGKRPFIDAPHFELS